MKKLIFFILCSLFLLSRAGYGNYSSVTVPISDPVYRQLDKLAAHGLIETMMRGQRPYVRFEIGRLIAEAMKNYPVFEAKYREDPNLPLAKSAKQLRVKIYVDRLLESLKASYRQELIQHGALEGKTPAVQGQIIDSFRAEYLYLSEDQSIIPPNNGLGGINAVLQPLVEYREGRHYQSGSNISFETHHWFRLSKYFSFQAEPRFQIQIVNGPQPDENKAYIQRLNGRLTFGKFDLEIGRDSIDWGPSSRGGLTFSSNPRPLDMIKVSSVSPFYFPFFFRHLGLHEMSLVIANLGPEQNFKNPWLVAYKISSRKNPYFEFGMTQSLILGGEGAPSVSLGQGFAEFFVWSNNDQRSFRQVAFEFIGRIPPLRGMEVYTELNFSDFSSNLSTLFVDDTSYLAGIYLPRLNNTGTLDLRLEYRRLAPRYARSPLFINGSTENTLLLGDPLGPDSHAVSLEFFYEMNPKNLLSFRFQYSQRNNKIYQVNGNSIATVADLGEETRFLYEAGIRHWFNSHLEGRLVGGIQQVYNVDFVDGVDKINWMAEAGITFHFAPLLVIGDR